MLRTLLTGLALPALAALLATAAAAAPDDLIVKYDQSQILKLPRPVSEIIIGNPSIADVTVQSNSLLVITGKSFGITNIIALDNQKNIIQDQRIIVQRDEAKVVTLRKGEKRQSYNCTPQCNPMVTVGDDDTYFGSVSGAAQKKMSMSAGSHNDKADPAE